MDKGAKKDRKRGEAEAKAPGTKASKRVPPKDGEAGEKVPVKAKKDRPSPPPAEKVAIDNGNAEEVMDEVIPKQDEEAGTKKTNNKAKKDKMNVVENGGGKKAEVEAKVAEKEGKGKKASPVAETEVAENGNSAEAKPEGSQKQEEEPGTKTVGAKSKKEKLVAENPGGKKPEVGIKGKKPAPVEKEVAENGDSMEDESEGIQKEEEEAEAKAASSKPKKEKANLVENGGKKADAEVKTKKPAKTAAKPGAPEDKNAGPTKPTKGTTDTATKPVPAKASSQGPGDSKSNGSVKASSAAKLKKALKGDVADRKSYALRSKAKK